MIDEIRQKIVDGAEFGDLARMYSEDSSQENYGDWGWIDRKKLNESLTKIAFALKPGEISQVIELGGSYYLLYCEAKKAGQHEAAEGRARRDREGAAPERAPAAAAGLAAKAAPESLHQDVLMARVARRAVFSYLFLLVFPRP